MVVMKFALTENGKIHTNESGERSRSDFSSHFFIQTYEDIDDGEKEIRRNVYLGDFDIRGNTWDLEKSKLEYIAEFEYHPEATKSTNSPKYPHPTTIIDKSHVETGIYYRIPETTNRPILDESIYEHTRTGLFRYSNFGDFDDIIVGLHASSEPIKITEDRSVVSRHKLDQYLPANWWKDPFSNPIKDASKIIGSPIKFHKKSADKITNFNPSTGSLRIDLDSFGIKGSATFTVGKNRRKVKKKLSKKEFDFLYDQKKGGLYFNENGAEGGFGDGGIVAILKGAPEIASEHLIFL